VALLVYIFEVVVLVVRGVQDGGVHVTRGCSSFQGELIIVVGHNAGKGALGGDTHGPRAHITAGSPGAGTTNKSSQVGDRGRTESWGDTEKVFGANEMVASDGVALVEPGGSNNVSRVEKVGWEEKEFGDKGVNGKKPSVPDSHPFGDREAHFAPRGSVGGNAVK